MVPLRYQKCATLTNLPTPTGGWSRRTALRALGQLRVSEIEKRDCLLDLADWSDGTLNGLRGTR